MWNTATRIRMLSLLALLIGLTGSGCDGECAADTRCVETCGGPETAIGCGVCPDDMIDVRSCIGADGGEADGGT